MENKDDNKERMLYLLALANGYKINSLAELDKKQIAELETELDENKDLKKLLGRSDRIDEKQMQYLLAGMLKSDYYQVVCIDDGHTCDNCKKYDGAIVCWSGSDPRYISYQEYANRHDFHYGCRCSLKPIDPPEMTEKDLERLAMNTNSDEILYTGFQEGQEECCEECGIGEPITYDYGETLVQIAPFGKYKGWDGEKAVDENVDFDACTAIVTELFENPREILVDKDHASCRSPNERSTEAMGWAYDFKVVSELGNLNGLYCKIKWTKEGRELAESRTYRFLSPVWTLDEKNRPKAIVSIGLTNRPAIKAMPIINTLPEEPKEKTMKEKLLELLNKAVEDITKTLDETEKVEEKKDEVKEDVKEEIKEEVKKEI